MLGGSADTQDGEGELGAGLHIGSYHAQIREGDCDNGGQLAVLNLYTGIVILAGISRRYRRVVRAQREVDILRVCAHGIAGADLELNAVAFPGVLVTAGIGIRADNADVQIRGIPAQIDVHGTVFRLRIVLPQGSVEGVLVNGDGGFAPSAFLKVSGQVRNYGQTIRFYNSGLSFFSTQNDDVVSEGVGVVLVVRSEECTPGQPAGIFMLRGSADTDDGEGQRCAGLHIGRGHAQVCERNRDGSIHLAAGNLDILLVSSAAVTGHDGYLVFSQREVDVLRICSHGGSGTDLELYAIAFPGVIIAANVSLGADNADVQIRGIPAEIEIHIAVFRKSIMLPQSSVYGILVNRDVRYAPNISRDQLAHVQSRIGLVSDNRQSVLGDFVAQDDYVVKLVVGIVLMVRSKERAPGQPAGILMLGGSADAQDGEGQLSAALYISRGHAQIRKGDRDGGIQLAVLNLYVLVIIPAAVSGRYGYVIGTQRKVDVLGIAAHLAAGADLELNAVAFPGVLVTAGIRVGAHDSKVKVLRIPQRINVHAAVFRRRIVLPQGSIVGILVNGDSRLAPHLFRNDVRHIRRSQNLAGFDDGIRICNLAAQNNKVVCVAVCIILMIGSEERTPGQPAGILMLGGGADAQDGEGKLRPVLHVSRYHAQIRKGDGDGSIQLTVNNLYVLGIRLTAAAGGHGRIVGSQREVDVLRIGSHRRSSADLKLNAVTFPGILVAAGVGIRAHDSDI